MHCKSLKNWDASKSQGLPVFGFGVAFVDESTIFPTPSNVASNIIEEISGIVSELGHALQELHIAPIETAFCKDLVDGQNCLRQLLDNITDASGKEDFVQYLRMLSLQKIAVDNKYTKVVLGSCTSKMAHQIISATVKGQGFALPADLQYVDTRQEIPVLLPLRDCNAQELGKLCFLDGLKTTQVFSWPPAGINGLVSSFIARLQDENPSRQRTIVRTAEKLKPFSFNKFTEGYYDFLPSIVRAKFQHVKHEEPEPKFLCPICGSPLSESEWKNVKNNNKCPSELEFFVSQCCRSCNFQILPKEKGKLELFYSLLPSSMTDRVEGKDCIGRRWLQEQIEEFLITDDIDET
ncbi:hypothetical protein HPP92_017763 [Vanilla planifolia]|uniref:Uncharacterized protein n=1 Tax=Vanilla planifolia TaxID=51239 RepID=A0A835Q7J3_VANPL|nr:hypothetical protein HPP92_017763 [Vanilla planifolia]